MSTFVATVLLFAALRERAGASSVQVELTAPATVADLLDAVARQIPRIASALSHCRVAVAQEFVDLAHEVGPDQEIALIPPVSGGHDGARIALLNTPLVVDRTIAAVADPSRGGIATFLGHVRGTNRGCTVDHLEYEAYEPMALAVMQRIADRIEGEISGARLAIHHRLGRLEIGECAVIIAAATPHRTGAFAACRLAIEALKRDVPIWKREVTTTGAVWIGLGP